MAVLVVCDSLRADLVDRETAPTLARLGEEGAHFVEFRGVFPSTTRTSAASIATGCLPAAHGLLGNTMVLDEGGGLECFSVGRPDFLDRLRRATGRALGCPTMHERVAPLGHAVAMSNVSPGAAYVLDPEGAGYVYHRSGSFGPGRTRLDDGLAIEVGADGDRVMTQRFCDEVIERRRPPLAVLWLSEPDHTGHHAPLGSPLHRGAIGEADRNVASVLERVERLDPAGERILLVVCSDHGMQTIRRRVDVDARLVEAGLKSALDSRDVVVAPQGTAVIIHVADEGRARLPDLVSWLEAQDFAGRVFAGEALSGLGLPNGGTLAVAVNLAGDDEPNDYGVRGRSDVAENALGGESRPGNGQHGGLGPYEQRPFLVLRGGGYRGGAMPGTASLIDLAPTMLRHLGLPTGGIEGTALPRGFPITPAARPAP
ncbi:MAG: alkaline phosphatase family protein [Betaproteobacteria bacterium]|nr:alkaline phosphatase family protein [Betaproteobacteria bacterium]